jgi:hypothetical protein
MSRKNLIPEISTAIASLNEALVEEIDKVVLAGKFEDMIANSPEDISARYWLMQFMEPLNRKELKQFVDGFLVQLLNEEQSKKLVKFLLIRFPNYYNQDLQSSLPMSPEQDKGDPIAAKEEQPKEEQPHPVQAK